MSVSEIPYGGKDPLINVEDKRLSGVSVVLPAYNDGGTIASMVVASLLAVRKVTRDYEVIVVNDGSQDHTSLILAEMAARCPELKVIQHPANRGYGCALRTGFMAATKEWVFYTDGDAQYNPLDLSRLVAAMTDGVDVVNGYKITRHDPLYRIVIGRLYHQFTRLAFGFHLRDVDCDFRLIRRKIFDQIPLESTDGTICVEMIKKFQDAGFVFAEAPVPHFSRPYGISQFFRPGRLWKTARQLFSLWWKLVVRKEHIKANPANP
jgi:glycosyltransferase involved in cell wall biosynthesis